MNKSMLEILGVTKKYHDVVALDNVSFVLETGKCLGIVGESGSGKSTLTRLLLGLETYDTGDILYQGKRVEKSKAFYKDVQLVFQNPKEAFNPRMKIGKAIVSGRQNFKNIQFTNSLEQLLEIVGLPKEIKDKHIHHISGGEAQRVAIARALALQPKILILDEITSSLDRVQEKRILDVLMKIKKEQAVSYIYISHALDSVKRITDEVLVMKQGKIIEQGLTESIFKTPKEIYTKTLIGFNRR